MPNHYTRAGEYPIEDVFAFINAAPHVGSPIFAGHPVHIHPKVSKRYLLFMQKGTMCVACGLKATFFGFEKHTKMKTDHYHFNLYGVSPRGNEVLFTKDHILPVSKGGGGGMENLQTMCQPCNERKGATVETKTG